MSTAKSPPNRIMPTTDEIEAEVRDIVVDAAGIAPDEIRPTSHLVNDLACDSLTMMEIAMEIEEQFDISVPDEFSEQYQTVGRIVEGIESLLQQSPKTR
jgi:acyl carrier protein